MARKDRKKKRARQARFDVGSGKDVVAEVKRLIAVKLAEKYAEDPTRFEDSRRVGSWIGLCPRSYASGDSNPELGISRSGDGYLRRLLVQCAQYVLGPFGKDSDLRRFGQRLIARGGRAARMKAVTAVARKLAVLLHRLWRQGLTYDPFHHTNRQTAIAV